VTSPALGADALRAMRTQRRRHRVEDLDWFEAMYRVYITAFLGGGAILFLSGLAGDEPLTGQALASVNHNTPHVVGLVAALVVFLGLRSGANGGPIAIEEPEVRHVLLSPVPHSAVLRHPAIQRLRTYAFTGALAGGTANQLLSRRIPHSGTSLVGWAIYGAVAGAIVGALFVIAALLAHALALPRWLITFIATALFAWQAAVTFADTSVAGPFDFTGSVSLWWSHFNILDAIAIVIVALFAVLAIVLAGNLSLEALSRRSALVSQMKFAVTLQDIRTVVLLRRQLSQEHMRVKPWFKVSKILRRDVVVGRGFRSFAHFPFRRLLRMTFLSITAAVALVIAWNGTTPAIVVAGLLLFVLGLDAVEPLSQEIDQPDRTDSLPLERGLLMTKHLIVPAILTAPFLVIGVITAFIMEPQPSTLVYATIIGIPALLGGIAGASLNAVQGAPDPAGGATSGLALPPEVSGMSTVLRAALAPAVTVITCAPVLVLRWSIENNQSPATYTIRAVLAAAIVLLLVGGWVRQRDAIRTWFNEQLSAAKPKSSTEGT
jgi:hypothetical protein